MHQRINGLYLYYGASTYLICFCPQKGNRQQPESDDVHLQQELCGWTTHILIAPIASLPLLKISHSR